MVHCVMYCSMTGLFVMYGVIVGDRCLFAMPSFYISDIAMNQTTYHQYTHIHVEEKKTFVMAGNNYYDINNSKTKPSPQGIYPVTMACFDMMISSKQISLLDILTLLMPFRSLGA